MASGDRNIRDNFNMRIKYQVVQFVLACYTI